MLNACLRIAAFVAVLVIGITPLRLDSQEASYELSGQARDVCGAVLPGTRIVLTNDAGATIEARAGSNGDYRFFPIPEAGSWRLSAELPGFHLVTIDRVTLTSDTHNTLNLRLLWITSVPGVVGTVTANGIPVVGASVAVRQIPKGSVQSCETDEQGRYAFFISDSGPWWRLTVSSPGFARYATNTLPVKPDRQLTFDVQLRRSREK